MHTAESDEEEGNTSIPPTSSIVEILIVKRRSHSYHSNHIEQNIGKDVAEHVTRHEYAIEQVAVATAILVDTILR